MNIHETWFKSALLLFFLVSRKRSLARRALFNPFGLEVDLRRISDDERAVRPQLEDHPEHDLQAARILPTSGKLRSKISHSVESDGHSAADSRPKLGKKSRKILAAAKICFQQVWIKSIWNLQSCWQKPEFGLTWNYFEKVCFSYGEKIIIEKFVLSSLISNIFVPFF